MADVGDEVAADRLDPAGLGEVLDQHQHQAGSRAGRPGRRRVARRRLAGRGTSISRLPDLAVPADLPGQGEQLAAIRRSPLTIPKARAAELARTTGPRVQHDGGRGQHRQHGRDSLWQCPGLGLGPFACTI